MRNDGTTNLEQRTGTLVKEIKRLDNLEKETWDKKLSLKICLWKEFDNLNGNEKINLMKHLYWTNKDVGRLIESYCTNSGTSYKNNFYRFSRFCFLCSSGTFTVLCKSWDELDFQSDNYYPICERCNEKETSNNISDEPGEKDRVTWLKRIPYQEYLQTDH